MNGSDSSREQWEEAMVRVRKGSLRLGEGELSRNGGLPLEVWWQTASTRTQRKTRKNERDVGSGI